MSETIRAILPEGSAASGATAASETSREPELGFLWDFWYPALRSTQIVGNRLATAMLLEVPLVLGRTAAGKAFAMRDSCPHRGIPLSYGRFDGKDLECSYHGWKFEACSGQCVEVPSRIDQDKLKLERIFAGHYPCEERDGYVWVYMASRDRRAVTLSSNREADKLSSIRDADKPSTNRDADKLSSDREVDKLSSNRDADKPSTNRDADKPSSLRDADKFLSNRQAIGSPPKLATFSEKYTITHLDCELPSHIDHGIIGLMDPAHGPFVHSSWFWRSRGSIHPKEKKFEPIPDGFRMSPHSPSTNSLPYQLLKKATGEPVTTTIDFVLPNRRLEEIRSGRLWFTSQTTVTPLRRDLCRIDFVAAWNLFFLPKSIFRSFGKTFLRQDQETMIQQSEGLKHNPRLMLIDDADRPAKWYFALKANLLESRRTGLPVAHPMDGPVTLRWRS